MKKQKAKAAKISPEDAKVLADKYGDEYTGLSEEIKVREAKKKKVRDSAIKLVDEAGEHMTDKSIVVVGDRFVVGKTVPSSSTVSIDKAKSFLEPDLFKSVFPMVKVRQFDEAEFIRLCELGKIPKKIVEKITVTSEGSPRIMVKTAEEFKKGQGSYDE